MSAIKVAAAEAPAVRRVPEISPGLVQLHGAGQCWREICVRLPAGVTAQDLNDSPADLWSSVQASRTACLQPLDHLTLIASDQSWIGKAIVASARLPSVTLSQPK